MRPIIRLIQIFFTWETVVFNVGLLEIQHCCYSRKGYSRCNSDKSFVLKWTWRTYLLPRHFIGTCNVTYHHRNLHSAVKYVLLYGKKCLTFLRGSLSSRKIVLIEIFFCQKRRQTRCIWLLWCQYKKGWVGFDSGRSRIVIMKNLNSRVIQRYWEWLRSLGGPLHTISVQHDQSSIKWIQINSKLFSFFGIFYQSYLQCRHRDL